MNTTPAQFTDERNRTWRLELNYSLAKRLRDVTGLDFVNYQDGKALLAIHDSDEKLVQVLWLLCEPQAQAATTSGLDSHTGCVASQSIALDIGQDFIPKFLEIPKMFVDHIRQHVGIDVFIAMNQKVPEPHHALVVFIRGQGAHLDATVDGVGAGGCGRLISMRQ